MAEMIELKEQEERVILVAVSTGEDDDTAASVDELEELASTAGRYGGKGDPEPGERPSRDVSGEGKDRRSEGAFMGAGRHRHHL